MLNSVCVRRERISRNAYEASERRNTLRFSMRKVRKSNANLNGLYKIENFGTHS